MQVTLKQSDIEKSLKDYITAQGIRTEGKKVEIIFTAGRRGTGVTAEITIEDVAHQEIPVQGLGVASAQTKTPVEVLKELGTITKVVTEVPASENEPANEPEAEAVPVKSVSLFG